MKASPSDVAAVPLTRLRGAGVEADRHRVTRIVIAVVMSGLVVLVGVLYWAGAEKNSQILRLQRDGVPVAVTISGCVGLLGGSGSNAAGYSCRGSFSLSGRRYDEPIPGNQLHAPGTVLHAVVVPGDPSLVSPVGAIEAERASAQVFVLPSVLLALWTLALAVLLLRAKPWRRPSRRRRVPLADAGA
jgi:hypothetical protein